MLSKFQGNKSGKIKKQFLRRKELSSETKLNMHVGCGTGDLKAAFQLGESHSHMSASQSTSTLIQVGRKQFDAPCVFPTQYGSNRERKSETY